MNIGQLIITLGADTTQLMAAQTAMHTFSKSTIASINTMSQRFRTFGYLATAALTVPIVMAGKAAMKMSMEYEASLSKVIGLVGIAREQVNAWSEDILKMAPEVGKNPKELADALYFITSAGIRGAEAMEVLEMSAKASAAGLGETKTVADLVTSAMNAYGIANLSAADATDILVATVREGKAEATALASTMGMVLPIASAMGVTFDQVGAGIAAMTRTGTSAATASMQLRQILNSLIKPSHGAEVALEAMKTSSAELRKTIREDGLLKALMDINDLTKKYGETTMGKVFPNIRALSGVLDIMGKNLGDNITIFANLKDSLGSLARAFSAASDTMKFKFNVASATAQVAMKKIGDYVLQFILPIFEWLSGILSKLSKWFDTLTEAQRRHVLVAVLIVATLGPFALLISLIGYSLSALAVAYNAVTAAVWRLNAAMAINPMTAAVGAIILIAAHAWLKYRSSVKEASDAQYTMNEELKRGKDLIVELNKLEKQSKAAELMSLEQTGGLRSKYKQALVEEQQLTVELAAEALKRIEGDKKVADLREKIANATNDKYKAGLIKRLQAMKEYITSDLSLEYEESKKRVAIIEKAQARIDAIFDKKNTANSIAEQWLENQREIDAILLDLTESLTQINSLSTIMKDLGIEYHITEEKASLFLETIQKLIEAGLSPQSEEVQKIINDYKALGVELLKEDSITEKYTKTLEEQNKELDRIEKNRIKGGIAPDYKKLFMRTGQSGGGASIWNPGEQDKFATFNLQLQNDLAAITKKEEILGNAFNQGRANVQLYTNAINYLIESFGVGNPVIDEAIEKYKMALDAQEGLINRENAISTLQAAFTDFFSVTKEGFENFGEYVKQWALNVLYAFENLIAGIISKKIIDVLFPTAKIAATTAATTVATAAETARGAATAATIPGTLLASAAVDQLAISTAALAAAWVPFPGTIAAVAANVGGVVAAIMAAKATKGLSSIAGMAEGGIVPPGFSNDSYPARLSSGEAVIPAPKALSSAGLGMQGQVVFRIEGRELVGILQKMDKIGNSF